MSTPASNSSSLATKTIDHGVFSTGLYAVIIFCPSKSISLVPLSPFSTLSINVENPLRLLYSSSASTILIWLYTSDISLCATNSPFFLNKKAYPLSPIFTFWINSFILLKSITPHIFPITTPSFFIGAVIVVIDFFSFASTNGSVT